MKIVYIGIGSNLENREMQVREAADRLKKISGVAVLKLSSLYKSSPMGPQDQPDYVNAVAEIETNLSAEALLKFLKRIEVAQERDLDAKRWGPRTIDLDILLFGDEQIQTDILTIPHIGLKKRDFVVYPLAEIAPQLILPTGETMEMLIAQCPKRDLRVIALQKDGDAE